jgi:hypothetical protein
MTCYYTRTFSVPPIQHEKIYSYVTGMASSKLHTFLTSALDGCERLDSYSEPLTPGKRAPGTQSAGRWVDLRAGPHALQ